MAACWEGEVDSYWYRCLSFRESCGGVSASGPCFAWRSEFQQPFHDASAHRRHLVVMAQVSECCPDSPPASVWLPIWYPHRPHRSRTDATHSSLTLSKQQCAERSPRTEHYLSILPQLQTQTQHRSERICPQSTGNELPHALSTNQQWRRLRFRGSGFTLQESRCSFRDISEKDLPPPIEDKTIQWRIFPVIPYHLLSFCHSSTTFLKQLDFITRPIFEEKPGSSTISGIKGNLWDRDAPVTSLGQSSPIRLVDIGIV